MNTLNSKSTAFEKIAIAYLFLPVILFLADWVNIAISIPILFLCLLFFFRLICYHKIIIDKTFGIVALISFFLTLLSGIGEFSYQNYDYEKHNAIYKILLTNDAPVYLKKDNKVYMLCYYLAYYIPSTFTAKLINNIALAPFLSFLWGWLGVFLVIFWLFKQGGIKLTVLFFFIGGVPVLPIAKFFNLILLYGAKKTAIYTLGLNRLYFGNGDVKGSLTYMSNLSQLFWSPQHVIGTWLCGIILYKALKTENLNFIFLSATSLFFWSPLVFIGAVPFYLFLLIKVYPKYKLDKLEVFISVICFLIIFSFFKAHLPNRISGFIFEYITSYNDVLIMILFIASELGAGLLFLIYYRHILSQFDYKLLLASILLLCLIPLYTIGLFNDFILRVSDIPLFYFTYVIGKEVSSLPFGRKKWLLTFIIILGFQESLVTVARSIINIPHIQSQSSGMLNSQIDLATYKLKFRDQYHDISDQYLGYRDSFFCKYIAK